MGFGADALVAPAAAPIPDPAPVRAFSNALVRVAALATLAACATSPSAVRYPETPRDDVVDDYFGTAVPDPYRWLEEPGSERTRAWVEGQNALSRPFLAALPGHAALRGRLAELWGHERYGVPRVAPSGALVYERHDGVQDHAVVYVEDRAGAEPRVLLDPNGWSADGTVAVGHWTLSPDGRHLLYARQTSGSDWVEYRLVEVASGRELPDRLSGVNFNFHASRIRWSGLSGGFFYSRFPGAGELTHHKVYFHRVGTPQSEDVPVYQRPEEPAWFAWADVTHDGRYLLVFVERTEDAEKEVRVRDLGTNPARPRFDAPWRVLRPGFAARYTLVASAGSELYFLTTDRAPRGRVVAYDVARPRRAPREVVPETPDVIEQVAHAGGELVVSVLNDASSRLRRYSRQGRPLGEIALPGTGSVAAWSRLAADALSARPPDPVLYFSYTSFATPFTIYRHDLRSGASAPFRALRLRFDPADYATEQTFAQSRDGTRIPVFVSRRRGLERDGNAPALLYGYGGFGISLTPAFKVENLVWMERGGVYAQACLRGGNEYGQEWHDAGRLARKQNVFHDFIAAAEHLVAERHASPDRLAISGRSNGGLLIGAVLNQRPDLFAAATQSVGVLDMLRYHTFGIGYAWSGDYGTAQTTEGFRYLHAYSPYHNIRPGTKYPPELVMTADHDDRVFPSHSFKYVAAKQAAQAGDAPVLIRIETRAGHGGGTPLSKALEEAADRLAFLERFTGGR